MSVQKLLELGANPEAININGEFPLYMIVKMAVL